MKMMSSTSDDVDQRGHVDLRPHLPLGVALDRRRCARRRAGAVAAGRAPRHTAPSAQDGVDQLGGGLVDVDGQVVEPRGEVVVEPDGDDRDAEADGGGDERLGDAGRHRADAAAPLGRVGQLLEGGDDAADGAEQADERRRRGDRRQHRHPAPQTGQLALLAPLHRPVDDLGDVERRPAAAAPAGRSNPRAYSCSPAPITLATGLPTKLLLEADRLAQPAGRLDQRRQRLDVAARQARAPCGR